MSVRVAIGTAICLGLKKGRILAAPTTAHLLTPGKCIYDCAYCTKARSSTSSPDLMCRITWPAYPERDVWKALEGDTSTFSRVCIQVVNGPGRLERVMEWVKEIRSSCDLPVSVELRTEELGPVSELLDAGANCVGLPLDVASADLHPILREGDLQSALDVISASARSHSGKVSSHIIVGLGETDKEILDISSRFLREGVSLALFAFTPCRGTRLGRRTPPPLERFRRIQIATHTMTDDPELQLEYDKDGMLVMPKIEDDRLRGVVSGALRTRGCEGCNRPFYNERPGCTPYNYPERLTEENVAEEMRVIR